MQTDPYQPRLRLHSLSGNYAGFSAVSLTYEYRITLIVDSDSRSITLYDIGSHDEVYR
jgi:mRNA-degrading endonuclease YafQ of YafQ-DinJ toxin-antitoxin module